ncbi:MAG: D-alanine--D-alanine ligase [Phycisphaeraceae bacterium]|nr:D-alanine--D-alanine ligase [Phycisphaeraceae bacterium]
MATGNLILPEPLNVVVLTGGPDRERSVSLMSADEVSRALRDAGHQVRLLEIGPDDLQGLDELEGWCHVTFPALHGAWGEGGALQEILARRGIAFVGSEAPAAARCMDKDGAKRVFTEHGFDTPPHEMVSAGDTVSLAPPVVVKPACEGSSIDLEICRDRAALAAARTRLHVRHRELMVERFVTGRELTVAVVAGADPVGQDVEALPPIQIVPATEYYDYEAKYEREDTQYRFDPDLPDALLDDLRRIALGVHQTLGCRHLSRTDFIVDDALRPWILEVNSIPGFTSHSLVPMAAARAGIDLPRLVDRLVRRAGPI